MQQLQNGSHLGLINSCIPFISYRPVVYFFSLFHFSNYM